MRRAQKLIFSSKNYVPDTLYSEFLLFIVVILYKVTINIEVENIEQLLLGETQG